jgi:hypothetical protein
LRSSSGNSQPLMKAGGPFRVHKCAPLDPILSQLDPPQLTSSRSVLILWSLLRPSLPTHSVLHTSQSKSCMHFSCLPKRETYSARYFLLTDLPTYIWYGVRLMKLPTMQSSPSSCQQPYLRSVCVCVCVCVCIYIYTHTRLDTTIAHTSK